MGHVKGENMNKYLNLNSKFNKQTFNKDELFDLVYDILCSNKIHIDDFKGNISCNEYYSLSNNDRDSFDVDCTFSWIFYPEDIPKSKFKNVAMNIEEIIKNQFKLKKSTVKCIRYDDSEYTYNGYDVELELNMSYQLEK